jgi:hypothetical protein
MQVYISLSVDAYTSQMLDQRVRIEVCG